MEYHLVSSFSIEDFASHTGYLNCDKTIVSYIKE